jgi:hypothetical protein
VIYVLDEPDITTSTTQTARPHNPLTHVENTPGKAQDNGDEHVVAVVFAQVAGVVALGVECVGGHDDAAELSGRGVCTIGRGAGGNPLKP